MEPVRCSFPPESRAPAIKHLLVFPHATEMALQAQQLPSFPFASPALQTLSLRCPLQSSSKCFLRSQSQFQTLRRRNHRIAYSPHRFLDHQAREGSGDGDEPDERWDSLASFSRGRLHGAREDKEGRWWGPLHCDETELEERLQESEAEDGVEVGEWDPPVSPFRGQREEQEEDEEEGDEDGGGPEWLDPSFFVPSQEKVSGICTTTTAAMKEILAYARSPDVDGPGFAEFLAGYSHEDLSEGDCVELMSRMGEEKLVLGCIHLLPWMREQGRLPVPPRALLAAVAALGRTGMVDELMDMVLNLPSEREFHEVVLYNAAMSAATYCQRYDDAWEIFELMEKNNVQPDHMTSSILLTVMKKTKASAKDAWGFFQRMNRKGVNWSLDVADALINIFCYEGLTKEALIIQSKMEKRGILSNTSIYNTLMKAYCKSNQIEEAEGLFVEMKDKGIHATTATYNILIDAYGKRLQPEVVELLLLEMQGLGLRPDARSYNCLISAYGRQKKMSDKAEDSFLRMKMDGIKPLSSSYTALLSAYAVNGLHEKAYTLYMDMKKEDLKPTLETYTALFHALRRAGDTERLMETWKSMIDEKVGGTRVTFHMVLDCLAKHGLYLQARDVMYEFGKIGLKPTVMTYNILMNAYGRGGQHYKLPQLLKEMVALELKPDSITYCTMIYAYARVRDFSRALYYHKQMVRSGQVPDARSYRKLLDTLDVKVARKNIKDKRAIQGIIKSKSGLKPRKEKKDEFWKNRKKRYMLNPAYGRQRKRSL